MKKLFLFMLAALPLILVSCDDDDDYYYEHPEWADNDNGALNEYERQLVGSYVSDDDPANPFYLVLRDNRTGEFKSVSGGQTTGETFTWSATRQKLTVRYDSDGQYADMEYYYENNHLYVDGIPLVVNNGSMPDVTVQTPLVGQWQGTITGYYSDVWGLEEDDCMTVCEFMGDGYGCQLDYDRYAPKENFAYTPFTWVQTNDVITVTYQTDSKLSAARISNYALTSKEFTGTIAYGDKSYKFGFESVNGFNWSPYQGDATAKPSTGMRMMRMAHKGLQRVGKFAQ